MHLGGGRQNIIIIIVSHESEKLALSTTEQPKLYVGQCNPMQLVDLQLHLITKCLDITKCLKFKHLVMLSCLGGLPAAAPSPNTAPSTRK